MEGLKLGRKHSSNDFDTRNFSKDAERDNERQRAKKRREYKKRDKDNYYADDDDDYE